MKIQNTRSDDAVNIAPDIHIILYEDDMVRVLKVTVKPGARAPIHWRPRNINYITSGGKLRFEKPEGTV